MTGQTWSRLVRGTSGTTQESKFLDATLEDTRRILNRPYSQCSNFKFLNILEEHTGVGKKSRKVDFEWQKK